MSIKITELQPRLTALANTDVFAVADFSEGVTSGITFGSLKNIIVDQATFSENADLIVNAVNDYRDPVTGLNELQATTIQSLDANTGIITPVDLAFLLNYNNHVNTPFIPTDVHQLNNFDEQDSGGFVRFRVNTLTEAGVELVYQPKQNGVISDGQIIDTTALKEGDNLYYTDNRVETFFDDNFGRFYNSFAATFDEGNVKDSYTDTIGQFILPSVVESETNVIRINRIGTIPGGAGAERTSQNERFLGYRKDQNIRIFGADGNASQSITGTADINPLVIGFRTEQRTNDLGPDRPHLGFSYRVAEWSLETGQSAVGSSPVEVYIGVPEFIDELDPEFTEYDAQRFLDAFSVENFIQLNFTGLPEGGDRGLLIYRRFLGAWENANNDIANASGSHELVAVLGPREIALGAWIDYYSDDILTYNKKFQLVTGGTANKYLPEETVLFRPKSEPSSPRKGWIDRTITEVRYQNPNNFEQSEYIDLYLDDVVQGESDGCWICHNDTTKIQQAINFNATNGRKAVQLNPKNYIVSGLTIPNDFGINGFAYNTSITKMPWSGYGDNPSNKILRASSGTPRNISFVGFDIQGNAVNQILFNDVNDDAKNYALDFGEGSDSILIDKVRVNSMIGGGIYANNGSNFKIFASEVKDSGLTDRNLFSPLQLQGGENTSIVSNRFENFTDNVNTSVTDKGVISGNIIVACGSGLLTYGSRFLVAEPNILIGPAGEFLPNPDAFNSQYDQINIDLSNSTIAGGFTLFESDKFVYQENGENFDLTGSTLSYQAYGIAKDPLTGTETEWVFIDNAEDYFAINRDPSTASPLSEGGFAFTISSDSVERLRSNSGRYTDVLMTNPGQDFVNGDIITIEGNFLGGNTGSNDITLNVLVANVATGSIEAFEVASQQQSIIQSKTYENLTSFSGWNTTGAGAGAVFSVKAVGGVYAQEFMRNTDNVIPVGAGRTVNGNANHIGLGWLSSIFKFVETSNIINTSDQAGRGQWTVPYEYPVGSGVYYSDYTIRLQNYESVSNTQIVTPQSGGLNAHLGFSAGTTYVGPGNIEHIPEGFGEIINSNELPNNILEVVIRWKWANYIDPVQGQTAVGGYGGKLMSRKDVVIAAGRIE